MVKKLLLLLLIFIIPTSLLAHPQSAQAFDLQQALQDLKDKVTSIYKQDSQDKEFLLESDYQGFKVFFGDKKSNGKHRIKVNKDNFSIDLSFKESTTSSAPDLITEKVSTPSSKIINDTNSIISSLSAQIKSIEESQASLSAKIESAKEDVESIDKVIQSTIPGTEIGFDELSKSEMVVKNSNVSKDLDIYYWKREEDLKEKIIIREKNPPSKIVFSLKTEGLTPFDIGNGVIYFKDKDRKYRFRITKGYVKDLTGAFSNDVNTIIEDNKLTHTLDPIWLNDPKRVYPLTVYFDIQDVEAITRRIVATPQIQKPIGGPQPLAENIASPSPILQTPVPIPTPISSPTLTPSPKIITTSTPSSTPTPTSASKPTQPSQTTKPTNSPTPTLSLEPSPLITPSPTPQTTPVETVKPTGKIINGITREARRLQIKQKDNQPLNFKSNETPEFEISLSDSKFTNKLKPGDDNFKKSVSAVIKYEGLKDEKLSIDLNIDSNKNLLISPKTKNVFRPGKYHLSLKIPTDSGEEIIEQDFTWGVLAINTNKSIYLPGDKAYIQMGSLDNLGHTLCESNLTLEITDPQGLKTISDVTQSSTCDQNNVTDNPDYFSYYQIDQKTGMYKINLTNNDTKYSISDSFEVKTSVPFIVERIGATRINPFKSDYKMTIKITANQDFDGQIIEQIPLTYGVTDRQGGTLTTGTDFKNLTWNIKMVSGEEKTIWYEYDPEEISPYLFTLGPLRIVEKNSVQDLFIEARQWQIASDLTCNSAGDLNWNAAASWSCGRVPQNIDDVYILTTHTITVNMAGAVAQSLTINSPVANSSTNGLAITTGNSLTVSNNLNYVANTSASNENQFITFAGTASLSVGGNFAIPAPTGNSQSIFTCNASATGTLAVTGTISITSGAAAGRLATMTGLTCTISAAGINITGGTSVAAAITSTTGTITTTNGITFGGTASNAKLTTTGAGTINLAGTMSAGGTVTLNTGTTLYTTSTSAINGAYTLGNLTVSSGTTTLGAAIIVANNLTVTTGTLSVGTNNLTVGLSSVANSGSIKVGGTISQSASATTLVRSSASGANCIGATGASCVGTPGTIGFYNLTIGVAGTTTTTTIAGTTPTVSVAGTLNITTNTTLSASGTLNVGVDFTKSGTFTANTSEVVLNGSGTQILSGASTFYKLTASTAGGRTINFPSSTTTTVSNTLTLSGTSCASQLTLAPSTAATAWTLTAPAGTTVTYISVSYSTSTNAITANSSTNGGNNNANWTINGCAIDLSGFVYSAEPSTAFNCSSNNLTLSISVNGAAPVTTTCTASGGTWSKTGVTASSGNIINVWVSGQASGTIYAQIVYVTDGTTKTDINFWQNTLAVRHDTGSNITNANLSTGLYSTKGQQVYAVSAGVLTVDANIELHVVSGDTFAPGNTVNFGGGFHNAGTTTWSTYTANFTGGSGSLALSGTLNSTSAFYKVNFNDADSTWTIQDSMLISAANAADTLQVTAGTVTLGDGTGDNLEVDGKFVISSGATFQTLSTLAQGSTIMVDINANTSPPSCTNCIVDASGTFTINKNATLRFNSNASVESGIEVSSTGILNITGSQDDTSTDTGTVSDATRETHLCATEAWTIDQHNNKTLMMTSGLAKGRIYTITDTIAGDSTNCATGTDDSISRADNSSTSNDPTTVSISNNLATITTSASIISADNEEVGRAIHNLTDNKWYLIVDSTEGGTADVIKVIGSPDSLTGFTDTDIIEISDGIKTSDTFEILDYATVTAQATNQGYIYSKTQSQTNIQYADVSELGASASCTVPTTNKCGITAVTIDGYTAGESFNISDSYIHDVNKGLEGYALKKATFNNNYVYNMTGSRPIHLTSLSNNTTFDGNRIDGNYVSDVGISMQDSTSYNITVSNNIIYKITAYTVEVANGSVIMLGYGNTLYLGATSGFQIDSTSDATLINNTIFHYSGIGIVYWLSNGNRMAGNKIFNTGTGIKQDTTSTNINYLINNDIGVEQTNSSADFDFDTTATSVMSFNTKLGSTNEVTNATAANAYFASFKHDQTGGSTKIWGEYPIPTPIAETPQSEEAQKFNYADNTFEDSFTPHLFQGSGTGTASLGFTFNGGTMGGTENHHVYRMVYNGTNWDVYRNESTGTPATATTNSLYTDTTTNARFTIPTDAGYAQGDTYSFVIYQDSTDTTTQKTVSMMQDQDVFTVPSGSTLELKGQSAGTNVSTVTRGTTGGYHVDISGTIDAQYYSFDYLGSTGGTTGLYLKTGTTVTNLSNGTFNNFQNALTSDAFITIDGGVIGTGTPSNTWATMSFTGTGGPPPTTPEYTFRMASTGGANYWNIQSATCTGWTACDGSESESGANNIRWTTGGSAPSAPTFLYINEVTAQSGDANPIRVDSALPFMSSQYNDADTGDVANKYQIIVYSDSGCTSIVWDSGSSGTSLIPNCTEPNHCTDITFAGARLFFDGKKYYWRMKYWDDTPTEGAFSACTDNYFTMLGPNDETRHGQHSGRTSAKRSFVW